MQADHQPVVEAAFQALDRALAHDEWEFVVDKKGVVVSSFAFEGESVSTFKGEGMVARHPREVLALLIDEKRRGEWDIFFADGGLLERVSETEGYVYYQTKSQGWTVWPRDFVMAISARIGDSASIEGEPEAKFVGVSVERADKPDQEGFVRAKVNLGGYYLLPVQVGTEIHTKLTYVLNVDAAGWIPYSVADFANTYQPLSILGLRKALCGTSDYPA